MLNLHTPSPAPAFAPGVHAEPGLCDHCDEVGLVTLTRRDGAICAACYAESCDSAGRYVRACECCSATEGIEPEDDDGRPWICLDCRAECHDYDDQGD
jgi:hypothetical protein